MLLPDRFILERNLTPAALRIVAQSYIEPCPTVGFRLPEDGPSLQKHLDEGGIDVVCRGPRFGQFKFSSESNFNSWGIHRESFSLGGLDVFKHRTHQVDFLLVGYEDGFNLSPYILIDVPRLRAGWSNLKDLNKINENDKIIYVHYNDLMPFASCKLDSSIGNFNFNRFMRK